jgi:hypothetical protein
LFIESIFSILWFYFWLLRIFIGTFVVFIIFFWGLFEDIGFAFIFYFFVGRINGLRGLLVLITIVFIFWFFSSSSWRLNAIFVTVIGSFDNDLIWFARFYIFFSSYSCDILRFVSFSNRFPFIRCHSFSNILEWVNRAIDFELFFILFFLHSLFSFFVKLFNFSFSELVIIFDLLRFLHENVKG